MVRLRNFTFRGDAIMVVAHLDLSDGTARPVYDVFLSEPEKLTGLTGEAFDEFMDKLKGDLDSLNFSYEVQKIFERFREDSKNGGEVIGVPVQDLAEE